ncbi:hypothetical protein [Allosphingosinicella sp.]|uniref:hypothetical protein n=1 Tax=Allosphingosinicella sp. TaxID=2823234 RepID=UPI003784F467
MIALALQVVAAFNLVCTGQHREGPMTMATPLGSRDGTPFSITYRVDLHRGRYCSGECRSTEALAEVTQGEIVFRFDRAARGDPSGNITRVNRETGLYTSTTILGELIFSDMGECQRAPFTGFPQPRF